jgi:hypothetical protein
MVNRKSGRKGVCLEKETHIIVTTLALTLEDTDRTFRSCQVTKPFPASHKQKVVGNQEQKTGSA